MKRKDRFEEYINSNSNFNGDYSEIKDKIVVENERNYKKSRRPLVLGLSLSFGLIGATVVGVFGYKFATAFFKTEENYKDFNHKYSLNDRKILESDSFKMLNDIKYSSTKENNKLDDDFVANFNKFSSKIFDSTLDIYSDFTVSTLSLYFELNNISLLSSSNEANKDFDTLLGTSKETRVEQLNKVFKNNFYLNNDATTQIYNSVFFNSGLNLNEKYIDILTNSNVEAYSMKFSEDNLYHIIDWVNQKLDTTNTLKISDLEFNDLTTIYVFSLLYFKNQWSIKIDDAKNKSGKFYSDGNEENVTYMSHSFGTALEDNEKYYSFYDEYKNGYKIKYIISKDKNVNTVDVVSSEEIFKIDSSSLINAIVYLSLPKFNKTCNLNMVQILKNIGFTTPFDYSKNNFPDVYEGYPYNQYIKFIKQFNSVDFNENGTTIKTVSFGSINGATSPDEHTELKEYDIKLDHPFIYVIYDNNNIPLYAGNVNYIN